MVWACMIKAVMRDNFSLLTTVEGREINHGVFNKMGLFHLGQRYSSTFVEITLILHNVPKGQVKMSLVPRACTSKS